LGLGGGLIRCMHCAPITLQLRIQVLRPECAGSSWAQSASQTTMLATQPKTNRLRDAVIRVSGVSPLIDPFDQCDRAAQDLAHYLPTPALGLGARQARMAIVIKINIEICML
jgi:hypothetical protein